MKTHVVLRQGDEFNLSGWRKAHRTLMCCMKDEMPITSPSSRKTRGTRCYSAPVRAFAGKRCLRPFFR